MEKDIYSGCSFISSRPHHHIWEEKFQGWVCEYSGLVHQPRREIESDRAV